MSFCESGSFEAVVLAGGKGTRLAQAVPDVPKPLAPVCGRPFVKFVLDALARQGCRHVVMAVGHRRQMIIDAIGSQYRGMDVDYSEEDDALGTGGAVARALPLCDDDGVIVVNGDTFVDVDYRAMLGCMDAGEHDAVIAVCQMEDCSRYGRVEVSEGRVVGFEEKRSGVAGNINSGTYCLSKGCLGGFPTCFSLEHDGFEKMLLQGRLGAVPASRPCLFIDIGIPDDYRRAQALMAPRNDKGHPIAFFDRDGTLNADLGHPFKKEDLRLIEKNVQLAAEYHSRGFLIVIITNQAGIAKGLYTREQMRCFNDELARMMAECGAPVEAFYYCPHHPDITGPCDCRKPAPGLILKALADYETDAGSCVLFGDKPSDVQAGRNAGVPSWLVD